MIHSRFCLGKREIGSDFPPLVIPEIGINHGGRLDIAKSMVDAAADAGAEIVKFQCHVVDDEMFDAAKHTIPGNASISIYEIMKQCSLSEQEERELKAYVESRGLIFLSTPFSRAAADRLEAMGVIAYKIGSGECNNLPLIEHIARFGKPMIISTGMNTIASVAATVEVLRKYAVPFALMHTTNLYPTPAHLVRLGGMQALMEHFPEIAVGLSDHTVSNHACFAAIALGASLVERHFTDRRDRPGPDIICSMTPAELKELMAQGSNIAAMRGGRKEPATEEDVTIRFAFATVGAIADIAAGEIFTEQNLWVRRPGTGEIPAARYRELLGKRARSAIASGTLLEWSMVGHD